MPLVTETEVRELVQATADRDVSMFIATADLLVTEELASAGLSSARLKQIELYLAAHFLTIAEERGGLSAIVSGESEERYVPQSELNKGLQLTRFGQQAIMLDTSGTLSSYVAAPLRAEFRVV